MSLEATMLILDNSSYSINATRLQAQADAVHVIFNRKLNANPENEVGLMLMAGKSPEVLVTPTQDEGKLIAALHSIDPNGQADLNTAIQVAQLALKHRQNKNQRQRIIVFVGSPIQTPSATLIKLGKKMKKNNVAIDIISFSSESSSEDSSFIDLSIPSTSSSSAPSSSTEPSSTTETTTENNEMKLQSLYESVNSSDNSHLVKVEPGGPHLLSERISQSPILRSGSNNNNNEDDDEMFGTGNARGGTAGTDDYGVDPNLDPELAMALRMSLEEERARQQAVSNATANTTSSSSSSSASSALAVVSETEESKSLLSDLSSSTSPTSLTVESGIAAAGERMNQDQDDDDDDDDLAKALALSSGSGATTTAGLGASAGATEDVEMNTQEQQQVDDIDDEDAEIARAIALSMQEEKENQEKETSK